MSVLQAFAVTLVALTFPLSIIGMLWLLAHPAAAVRSATTTTTTTEARDE